jgi:hypothetical protein
LGRFVVATTASHEKGARGGGTEDQYERERETDCADRAYRQADL